MSDNCWQCAQAKVGGTPCEKHAALPPVRSDAVALAARAVPSEAMLDLLTRMTYTIYEVACVLQSITPSTPDGIAARQRVSERCMDMMERLSALKFNVTNQTSSGAR